MPRKIIAFLISFCLIFEQTGFAQIATSLGVPAYLNRFGPVADAFRPIHLRALTLQGQTDKYDLLLDKGDSKDLNPPQIESSAQKLLEYFRIGLILPNSSFWVNLRPDAPEDIIDPEVEKTDIGRIFLEADVQLKKDMARFTSPDTPEGREYWDKLYAKAEEIFGPTDVSIPTITRPWIVPGEIIIGESQHGAYIYKATLKVMLEQDYLKDSVEYSFEDERQKQLNDYSSEVLRRLIIPKLTREVNAAKRYASLRQVYYSLILAQWVKAKFRDTGKQVNRLTNEQAGVSSLFSKIDSRDLTGLASQKRWSKQTYYRQYQKSFKDGEYSMDETVYSAYGMTMRQYFSGGIAATVVLPSAVKAIPDRLIGPTVAVTVTADGDVLLQGENDRVKKEQDTLRADGGEMKFLGEVEIGGEKQKEFWADDKGQLWIFKINPYTAESYRPLGVQTYYDFVNKAFSGQPISVRTEDPSGKSRSGTLEKIILKKNAPPLEAAADGQAAAEYFWKYAITNLKAEINSGKIKVTDLSALQTEQVLREMVIDWLFSNHDSHPANFLIDEQGNIIGIDKEQVFKYFLDPAKDVLSLNNFPNGQSFAPLFYSVLVSLAVKGKLSIGLIDEVLKSIEAVSDEEMTAIILPFAKEYSQAAGITEQDFVQRFLARKHNLRHDFEQFFTQISQAHSVLTKAPIGQLFTNIEKKEYVKLLDNKETFLKKFIAEEWQQQYTGPTKQFFTFLTHAVEKTPVAEKAEQEPVFHAQPALNLGLSALYGMARGIIARLKESVISAIIIRSLIEEYYEELLSAPSFTAAERAALDEMKKRLIEFARAPPEEIKRLKIKFVLLAAWVGELRQRKTDFHRVYLARDAGFFHLLDRLIEQEEPSASYYDTGSSVYYLSRYRMSGESSKRLYNKMQNIITEAQKTLPEKNLQALYRQIRAGFRKEYEQDPQFRAMVDAVAAELREAGYDIKNKLIFVDTGFLGTIPFFLKNVLDLNRQEWELVDETGEERIQIAIIQPSSISAFAKDLLGFDLEMFPEGERQRIEDLARPFGEGKDLGSSLEDIRAHPVQFDEGSWEIQYTDAATQLEFFYEQIIAILAFFERRTAIEAAAADQPEYVRRAVSRSLISQDIKTLLEFELTKKAPQDFFVKPEYASVLKKFLDNTQLYSIDTIKIPETVHFSFSPEKLPAMQFVLDNTIPQQFSMIVKQLFKQFFNIAIGKALTLKEAIALIRGVDPEVSGEMLDSLSEENRAIVENILNSYPQEDESTKTDAGKDNKNDGGTAEDVLTAYWARQPQTQIVPKAKSADKKRSDSGVFQSLTRGLPVVFSEEYTDRVMTTHGDALRGFYPEELLSVLLSDNISNHLDAIRTNFEQEYLDALAHKVESMRSSLAPGDTNADILLRRIETLKSQSPKAPEGYIGEISVGFSFSGEGQDRAWEIRSQDNNQLPVQKGRKIEIARLAGAINEVITEINDVTGSTISEVDSLYYGEAGKGKELMTTILSETGLGGEAFIQTEEKPGEVVIRIPLKFLKAKKALVSPDGGAELLARLINEGALDGAVRAANDYVRTHRPDPRQLITPKAIKDYALPVGEYFLEAKARVNDDRVWAEFVFAFIQQALQEIARQSSLSKELLKTGDLSAVYRKTDSLPIVIDQSAAELSLFSQLLTLERVRNPVVVHTPEKISSVKSMIEGVIARARAQLNADEKTIFVSVTGDASMTTYKAVLDSLIWNYTANGIKYRDTAKAESRIDITIRQEDGRIIIDYADNGQGMTPEEVVYFFKGAGVLPAKENSSGTGARIVLDTLRALGGEYRSYDSRVGQGTRFSIVLDQTRSVNYTERLEARYSISKHEAQNGFAGVLGIARMAGDEFLVGDKAVRERAHELGDTLTGIRMTMEDIKILLEIPVLQPGESSENKDQKDGGKGYFDILKTISGEFGTLNTTDFGSLYKWFASNEEVISGPEIEKLKKISGGVYVGVGYGGQNFSKLAKGTFDYAVIIDINPFVTEMFMPLRAAFISLARNRVEYLGLLSSVEFTEEEINTLKDSSLQDITKAVESKLKTTDRQKRQKTISQTAKIIESAFPLELKQKANEFWEHYSENNRVDSKLPNPFGIWQMTKSLMGYDSWLANEENFQKIKTMTQQGRILGITGNWLDSALFDRFSSLLTKEKLNVSCIYTSNLLEWDLTNIAENTKTLFGNIQRLPGGEKALYIQNLKGKNRITDLEEQQKKQWLKEADGYLASGDWAEAASSYIAVLNSDRTNKKALAGLAKALRASDLLRRGLSPELPKNVERQQRPLTYPEIDVKEYIIKQALELNLINRATAREVVEDINLEQTNTLAFARSGVSRLADSLFIYRRFIEKLSEIYKIWPEKAKEVIETSLLYEKGRLSGAGIDEKSAEEYLKNTLGLEGEVVATWFTIYSSPLYSTEYMNKPVMEWMVEDRLSNRFAGLYTRDEITLITMAVRQLDEQLNLKELGTVKDGGQSRLSVGVDEGGLRGYIQQQVPGKDIVSIDLAALDKQRVFVLMARAMREQKAIELDLRGMLRKFDANPERYAEISEKLSLFQTAFGQEDGVPIMRMISHAFNLGGALKLDRPVYFYIEQERGSTRKIQRFIEGEQADYVSMAALVSKMVEIGWTVTQRQIQEKDFQAREITAEPGPMLKDGGVLSGDLQQALINNGIVAVFSMRAEGLKLIWQWQDFEAHTPKKLSRPVFNEKALEQIKQASAKLGVPVTLLAEPPALFGPRAELRPVTYGVVSNGKFVLLVEKRDQPLLKNEIFVRLQQQISQPVIQRQAASLADGGKKTDVPSSKQKIIKNLGDLIGRLAKDGVMSKELYDDYDSSLKTLLSPRSDFSFKSFRFSPAAITAYELEQLGNLLRRTEKQEPEVMPQILPGLYDLAKYFSDEQNNPYDITGQVVKNANLILDYLTSFRSDNTVGSTIPQGAADAPVADVRAATNKDGGKGGIDLRRLPIATQPAVNSAPGVIPAALPAVNIADLDKEWQQIQMQMQDEAMPYVQIKEYVAFCKQSHAQKHLNAVLACIADILRLEEERAISTAPELKEILGTIG